MHEDPQAANDFETFRTAVLADRALQAWLDSTIDPEAFVMRALQAANTLGLRLEADRLRPCGRGKPVAAADSWPSPGWLPATLRESGGHLVVDWAHFGQSPLTHSFYADSLAEARCRPFNRAIRYASTLEGLLDGARTHATTPLGGLVFHMSRCGSTMVSQMLGTLDATIAVAEPGPLDCVIRLAFTRPDIPRDRIVALLRAMLAALARPRNGERRCFIKLDSWHILAMPLFRAAFPDVPWIYLFRDPIEVLVSQVRMRGYQTVPSLMPPGLYGPADATVPHPADQCARIFALHHAAAIREMRNGGGRAIDYATLPDAFGERIAPHFALALTPSERRRLGSRARYDSKARTTRFVADTERKRAEASAAVLRAADAHLAALHETLRAMARQPAPCVA